MSKGLCYCLMASCVLVIIKGENQTGPRDNAAASVSAENGRAAKEVTETRKAQLKALWDYYNRTIENYRKVKRSWRDNITEKPNITALEEKILDEDKKIIDGEKEKSTDAPKEKMLDEDKKPTIKEKEKSTEAPEEKMLDEDKKIIDEEKKTSTDTPVEKMLDEEKKIIDEEKEKSTDAPEEKMPDGDKKIVDDQKKKPDNATEGEMLDGENKKPVDKEKETSKDELGPRDNVDASVNAEDGKAAEEGTETREAQLKALSDYYNRTLENYWKLQSREAQLKALSDYYNRTLQNYWKFKNITGQIDLDSTTESYELTSSTDRIWGLEVCSFNEFQCKNRNCIPRHYVCNNEDNCGDRSDEVEGCGAVEHFIYLDNFNEIIIKHPLKKQYYGKNENIRWIIKNNSSYAVGFIVNVTFLSVEECCDKLVIQRPECQFETIIRSIDDGPDFIPGHTLNITFTSDVTKSYYGFILDVQATNESSEVSCPGNKTELSLDKKIRTITIKHPEDGKEYGNNEQYLWIIRNKDPKAVGFEVTVKKMEIQTCCDQFRIKGDYCNYGSYTAQRNLSLRGKTMYVTWTSDFMETGPGFILKVKSLYKLNKTDCYDYTCDDRGRCLRIHYDDELTWHDSVVACEAEGARLAVIRNKKMDKLASRLADRDAKSPWIGTSGNSFDNMTWVNGRLVNAYGRRRWRSDAPNIFRSKRKGCGVLYSLEWGIARCSASRPFICEKSAIEMD